MDQVFSREPVNKLTWLHLHAIPRHAQSNKRVLLLPPFKRDVEEQRVGKDDWTQIPKWNRKNKAETRNRSTQFRGTVLERETHSSPADKQQQKRGWRTLLSPDNIFLSTISPQKKKKKKARQYQIAWITHALLVGLHNDSAILENGKWRLLKKKKAIPIQTHNYTLWHFKGRNGDLFSHQNL